MFRKVLTTNSDPVHEKNYPFTSVMETQCVYCQAGRRPGHFSKEGAWRSQKFRPQSYVISGLMIFYGSDSVGQENIFKKLSFVVTFDKT
jgi:hypothetical protein